MKIFTHSTLYSPSLTWTPSYLAGEDVAKRRESVVQRFVVDGLVEVLDEHVANSGLPEGGVSLGPHDPDRLPFDHVKVHGVQGSLG